MDSKLYVEPYPLSGHPISFRLKHQLPSSVLPEEPARPQRGLEDFGDLVERLLGRDLLEVGAAVVGAGLRAGVHGDLPLPPHVRLGPDQHDGEVGAVLAELNG